MSTENAPTREASTRGATRKIDRSPEYPASSLKTCIEQVRRLYDQDRQNWTSTEVAARHLGYKSLNGTSRTSISAIKKFGLIEYRGGDLRVSDLAMRVLVPKEDSERAFALDQALVGPKLYAWVLDEYPNWDLPSDDTLHARLVRDLHFNAGSTKGLLADLRESIEFVRASGGLQPQARGTLSNDSRPDGRPQEHTATPERKGSEDEALTVGHKLSIPGQAWYVWLPDDMRPVDAKRMKSWVENVLLANLRFLAEEDSVIQNTEGVF